MDAKRQEIKFPEIMLSMRFSFRAAGQYDELRLEVQIRIYTLCQLSTRMSYRFISKP